MPISRDTDQDWKHYGDNNPYYGVCSDPAFATENLTPASIEKFYTSGEEHTAELMRKLGLLFGTRDRFQRVLDFGCGVGRLAIPLARFADEVVGVDISEGMLTRARERSELAGVSNASFEIADDNLANVRGTFDLIHSFIVFQHIPVVRGLQIVDRLVDMLTDGGLGCIHLTFGFVPGLEQDPRNAVRKKLIRSVKRVLNQFPNFVMKPYMQMNDYPLPRVLSALYIGGIPAVHLDFVNHDGHLGAYLMFQKPAARTDRGGAF